MNLVDIECGRCGDTAVAPTSALFVEVDSADPTDSRVGGTVRWICATCEDLISTPVGWKDLLAQPSWFASLVEEA